MTKPLSIADLLTELSSAQADYRSKWQTIDQELYGVCRRRPSHQDFGDVYAKVTIIGRVYAAGILRSSRAAGDREAAAASGISQQGARIEAALQGLAAIALDRAAAAQIIELHARTTRDLKEHTGDRWLQSFVSKYLHFHCAFVPIYDSRAEANIGRFVDWAEVYQMREAIGRPPDWLTRYYNFATAFVVLSERLAAVTGAAPSVKEIDHLLWHAG